MDPAPATMPSPTPADLLEMKVSVILEARPASLEVLIAHGFTPLKQPQLRAVLAHTVTLAQALRIRSLTASRERALLVALVALFASDEFATPDLGQGESTAPVRLER